MLKVLAEKLVEGTQEVFTMMADIEVEGGTPDFKKTQIDSAALTSMLGLGGDLKGLLAVHCTGELAKGVTSSFLGMDVTDLDEDVKDAIGEIANMIAGNIKIAFAELGLETELAIPTTIIGESFKISGFSQAENLLIPFNSQHGKFWVELKFVKN